MENKQLNILIGKDAGKDLTTESLMLIINTEDGVSYKRQMRDEQEYRDTMAMINYLVNLKFDKKVDLKLK